MKRSGRRRADRFSARTRTLGSVIKLLTPSEEYTDEYNTWLESIPPYIKVLVFVVKRYYPARDGRQLAREFQCGRDQRHARQ